MVYEIRKSHKFVLKKPEPPGSFSVCLKKKLSPHCAKVLVTVIIARHSFELHRFLLRLTDIKAKIHDDDKAALQACQLLILKT